MSQKKCPKCGEMNPAEAVMCWACYTPLTGGAVAAGGGTAAMANAPAAASEKKEKQAIAPWQLGVVGVAVLLALGLGASQMMGGGESVDSGADAGPVPKPVSSGTNRPTGPSPDIFTGTLTVPNNGGGQGVQVPISEALDYSVASPPNPDLPWGVVGLVPNDPNVSPQRAAGMAQFAYQQFGGKTKFKAMQIFVFRNREAALQFNRFQISNKYDVVADDDYPGMATLWPQCIVRYEVNGNAAPDIRHPYQSPSGWWRGRAS